MLALAAASFLSFHFSAARAACTLTADTGVVVPYLKVTLPAWDSATFDPAVPDGTVVFSGAGSASGPGGRVDCGMHYLGTGAYEGKGPVGRFETYATPVSGMGVRIRGGIKTNSWWPQSSYFGVTAHDFIPGSKFSVELVKTGPITTSGVLTGEIGTTTLVDQGNQVIRRIFINGSLPIRPLVPACKVTTSSVAVPLGRIRSQVFKGVGTTTDSRPFEIRLQCSGGTKGAVTRMHMTMTDSSSWWNQSSVLSLSSNSSASGIGIQILRGANDSVVSYGPDSSQSNNTNQWFVGQFGNDTVTIPFKARYIQTSSTVKPGVANGLATFTMSYQ